MDIQKRKYKSYSNKQYNNDLITYLTNINTNYEYTINDPKLQQIKNRIINKLNLTNNLLLPDYNQDELKPRKRKLEKRLTLDLKRRKLDTYDVSNSVIENSEDEREQMVEDSEDENVYNSEFRPINYQQNGEIDMYNDLVLEGGIRRCKNGFIPNFENIYKKMENEQNFIKTFDDIRDYINNTEFLGDINFNFTNLSEYECRSYSHYLIYNFVIDISALSLNIPTIKPDDHNYIKTIFWLMYFTILFNNKYSNNNYIPIYKFCSCNNNYIPNYANRLEINVGNCKHTSVFGYLYLLNPEILFNIVINELNRIVNLIKDDQFFQISNDELERIAEYCRNNISNLMPSVLFQLVLTILNKNGFNIYNGWDTITYDHFKNELVFNKFNNYIQGDVGHDIPIRHQGLLRTFDVTGEITVDGNNYVHIPLKLKRITASGNFKEIELDNNFIFDTPFAIGVYMNPNSKHAIVFKPIKRNIFQLIDPNRSNHTFNVSYKDSHIWSDLITFRNDKNNKIILIISSQMLNYIANTLCVSTKNKTITQIASEMLISKRGNRMYLFSVSSTYKEEYTQNILNRSGMICQKTSVLPLNQTINHINEIRMFVLTNRDQIYYKDLKLEEDNISSFIHIANVENFFNLLIEEAVFKPKILFDMKNNKRYLYINDYVWTNSDDINEIIQIDKNGNRIKQNQTSFTPDLTKGFYALVPNIQNIINDLKKDGCFLNEEHKKNIETQFQLKGSSLGSFMNELHHFLITYKHVLIALFILILTIILIIIISLIVKQNQK